MGKLRHREVVTCSRPVAGERRRGDLNPCLVAQLVKNPPAMQEIWVRSLGREDPLEKR